MVLTDLQKQFLNWIATSSLAPFIYWTWGTALAWQYNHRLSTDLDFFSRELLHDDDITLFNHELNKAFTFTTKEQQTMRNRRLFFFDDLKIELTFFPFRQMYNQIKRENTLLVDHPKDIGVNKIHAVTQRLDMKDIIDLMYICEQENVSIQELVNGAEEKFWLMMDTRDIIARMVWIAENQQEYIQQFLLFPNDIDRAKLFVEHLV